MFRCPAELNSSRSQKDGLDFLLKEKGLDVESQYRCGHDGRYSDKKNLDGLRAEQPPQSPGPWEKVAEGHWLVDTEDKRKVPEDERFLGSLGMTTSKG